MVGDVRIENLNVGNMLVIPDSVSGGMSDGIFAFLREQAAAGANLEVMGEDGYPAVSEDIARPDDTPTPEEQAELDQGRAEAYVLRQAAVDARARANHLRNAVSHVTPARKLEGFQTNHERSPRKRPAVNKKQAKELEMAGISLKRACALCIFQNDCKLVGNIDRWVDVHPYKRDKSGKRRPGSSEVGEVESQNAFLESLDVGVAEKRQIHCDPAKRK